MKKSSLFATEVNLPGAYVDQENLSIILMIKWSRISLISTTHCLLTTRMVPPCFVNIFFNHILASTEVLAVS